MAKARLVCGDCGNVLSSGDRFCAKCGARVGTAEGREKGGPSSSIRCEACGHDNGPGGIYCEACGVKLSGASVVDPPPKKEPTEHQPHQQKAQPAQRPSRKFEPWHYAAGVAVICLLGYFIYLEARRDTGGHVHQQPTQVAPPQSSFSPPPPEIMQAIERLEKTVRENPADNGAKLLLANHLHDAAMHDPRMFPRAVEAYKEYLKESPDDPNARVDLGICYFELGKIDTARTSSLFSMAVNEMNSALKKNPSHQPGAFNLGIVYLFAGDMKESNRWFKKTVEMNAESDLGKRAKAILDQHSQAGL